MGLDFPGLMHMHVAHQVIAAHMKSDMNAECMKSSVHCAEHAKSDSRVALDSDLNVA